MSQQSKTFNHISEEPKDNAHTDILKTDRIEKEVSYIEYVKSVYPQLHIQSYTPNDIGQSNDVFILNDTLVFRFPKYKKGMDQLKRETEILNYISHYISIQIPNPIYSVLDTFEIGKVFAGYEIIKGEPLWKENILAIENKQLLVSIAKSLAQFLLELHSVPKEPIIDVIKSNTKHPIEEMSNLYEEIKNKLFSFIKEDAQIKITQSFRAFLESDLVRELDMTLIHGDYGASNIIWLPETKEVAGVIDFGNSRLGDPAYDFAGILSSYGEQFFNLCIEHYPNGHLISERAKFYKSTFALQEALHGVIYNDKQAFADGIKDYI